MRKFYFDEIRSADLFHSQGGGYGNGYYEIRFFVNNIGYITFRDYSIGYDLLKKRLEMQFGDDTFNTVHYHNEL